MSKFIFGIVVLCALVAASQAQVPQHGHVFIVLEENHDFSSITASSMPYLTGLAAANSLATQYYANTHPSIGNYFVLTTGQILTNDDGQSPGSFPVSVDNVVRELLLNGKTWKSYAENLPSVGYTGGDSGGYTVHHNPFPYFTDVQNSSAQKLNLVPFTQFATDLANNALPNYSFIVPTNANNAHDGSLGQADTWLKNNIDPLVKSAGFQQDGLLIVVFDESGGDNTNGGGKVYWTAVGPKVKKGFQSANVYQHQSTLRLSLEALGITSGFPGAASSAPSMAEFFGTSPPPPPVVAIVISPKNTTVASGGTRQFTATVTGTANTAVNWSATSGTVSGSGFYTAPSVNANTTATVKATSVADSTKSDSATVAITATPPPVVAVTISPKNPTVVSGGTQQFTAAVTGTANTAVNWSATAGTISNTGFYTAPVVNANSQATVKATSVADSMKSDSTTVSITVTPPPPPPPPPPATGSIPAAFFGMHENSLALHGWPSVSSGSFRVWDLYPNVTWMDINTARGVYNWAALDSEVNLVTPHGVDIVYTFGKTPAWASSNPTGSCGNNPAGSCYAPANEQDWKDFVNAITLRYQNKIKYWELWNEADATNFWGGTIAQLNTMAADAYPIIKANGGTVLTPTAQGINAYTWMNTYLQGGGGNNADVIAFHGYLGSTGGVSNPPEGITTLIANMKNVMSSNGQGTKQLWDTEHSWGSSTDLPDQDQQAGWLARHVTLSAARNVSRSFWYGWDYIPYGTLWDKTTGVITKAGTAYGEVHKWLQGGTFTNTCAQSGTVWTCDLTLLAGTQGRVVWDTAQSCSGGTCTTSTYMPPSQFTKYHNLAGNTFNIPTGGTVQIGAKPILLEGGTASVASVSISISPPSAAVVSGGTQQFTATVTGTTNTAVTWSATAGSVSASGLYTAPAVTAHSTATVTATSVADPTKSASTSVSITAPPSPVAVSISPISATVVSGGTRQFTATVSNTSNTALTWSATAGGVSSSGLYTAPTVNVNTGTTVKVTSVADSTKSATASITITPPPTSPNFALSVAPLSQTVVRGSTTKYTINVTPSSGFSGSVAFAVTGLSGGASASFSPASVTVSGTTSAFSTMSIATGRRRTRTFTLTISASSGTITHTTTVSLRTTR